MTGPTHEQIRTRAQQLGEIAGRPEGRQDEFWHEAEREFRNSDSTNDPEEKSGTVLE